MAREVLELVERLPRNYEEMLAKIGDEEHRQGFLEILIHTQHNRVAHGFPPNPPDPLTLDQMKEGETRNAEQAVVDALSLWAGSRAGVKWLHHWLDHGPIHDRDLPDFAFRTIMADCWDPQEEVDLVSWAWTEPAWPEANLGTAPWRKLWARVGYLHETRTEDEDDDPSTRLREFERPTEAMTLYRGAIASRKRGMAWTTNFDRAVWFRNHMSPASGEKRNGPLRQAKIYRCVVPPERVFAHFEGRGEDEWVVDVRALPIEEVTSAAD